MKKDVRNSAATSIGKSVSLGHYFHFYLQYSNFGPMERAQLVASDSDVALTMINLMLEEVCPTTQVKSQSSEFVKLYQVVSILLRCYNLSRYCTTAANKEVNFMLHFQTPNEVDCFDNVCFVEGFE